VDQRVYRPLGDRRHRALRLAGQAVRLHRAVPQSGATDRRGPISKHGPKYVRWTLFEAAMNACKHPVYTECYQHTKRPLGRRPDHPSRRLTEAIWHMLTRNQSFAPAGALVRLAA
jgi:transposase